MQAARNSPSRLHHRVACARVRYTYGMKAGDGKGRAPQGTDENQDGDPSIGSREEGSDP